MRERCRNRETCFSITWREHFEVRTTLEITWQDDIVKEQELQDQGELYSVGKEGVRRPPGHDGLGKSAVNEQGVSLPREERSSPLSLEPWRGQSKELR